LHIAKIKLKTPRRGNITAKFAPKFTAYFVVTPCIQFFARAKHRMEIFPLARNSECQAPTSLN
jgi:hypothetical protein